MFEPCCRLPRSDLRSRRRALLRSSIGLRVVALVVALAVFSADVLFRPAQGQQAAQSPSLEGVFDKKMANEWTVVQGDYTVAGNDALGKPVLTAGANSLTLESKMPQKGGLEVRALVRLRNEGASRNADFYFAKKDANDPGLRFFLSAAPNADGISCLVQQAGKPLHDTAALAKTLDWEIGRAHV